MDRTRVSPSHSGLGSLHRRSSKAVSLQQRRSSRLAPKPTQRDMKPGRRVPFVRIRGLPAGLAPDPHALGMFAPPYKRLLNPSPVVLKPTPCPFQLSAIATVRTPFLFLLGALPAV